MNAVWENLDTFLDTDDFAIQATLRLQSGSWACRTQCFTEKGLSQCAGVDFNAPQGPWKMPQPVMNLTVRPF